VGSIIVQIYNVSIIHSTSRSESTNSYFKDYVIPKDTIENFMRQFEIIQEAKALPRRMKTGLQV